MADDISQTGPNHTQPETLDQRVQALEKSVPRTDDKLNWGLDILKWGLGVFTTVAVLFAGGNAWLAKSNYDRDEKALNARLDFLKQQLSADNDRQLSEMRRQSESFLLSLTNSFLSLSNASQNQLLTLQGINFAYMSNAFQFLATNLLATNLTIMMQIASNNDSRFKALVTNVNVVLSNSAVKLESEQNDILAQAGTNINAALAKALGAGQMLQGNMISKRLNTDKVLAEASAARSYMQACRLLYAGHDEQNLRRCLAILCDDCLQQLVRKNSNKMLQVLVPRYNLTSELKFLIADLTAGNEHQRYDDSIDKLQYYLSILEGKVIIRK